jgi:thiol-disulfide isomerase/thioredoxin
VTALFLGLLFLQEPRAAASLTLPDLSGRRHSLEEQRGRIVVLNFWATWCVPCREEMPLLQRIHERYAGHGVVVIAASVDDESTRPQIAPFLKKLKISFPVWTEATVAHMREFGLGEELPATVLIGREGEIAGRILGVIERKDIESRLDHLLGAGKGPAPPPITDNRGEHEGEDHAHGGVGLEGASSVPS